MVRLLSDGKPAELDDPTINIASWWIYRTRGEDDDKRGMTTLEVSDAEFEKILDYFLEVGNGD